MKTLIGLFASLMLATTAYAQNFVEDVPVRVGNTILCDTFESIDEIATAQQESWEAARTAYLKWMQTKTAEGDVICAATARGRSVLVRPIQVVKTYENVFMPSGETTTMNVIAVMWPFNRRTDDWRPGFIIARQGVGEPKGDPA